MLRSTWTLRQTGGARPHAAERLVAAPWRHPALVLACAFAGAAATAALAPIIAHGHIQPILPAPDVVASTPVLAGSGGPGLRLDLEFAPGLAVVPGEGVSRAGETRLADAWLDAGFDDEAIDALLKQSPPAGGRPLARVLEQPPTPAGLSAGVFVPGLLAGLLLGLLAAAARELRGDRMRSASEAEWALGAPVLGAIPTLSARARRALLAPASRGAGAGRA
ncbi:MAG: hypothetical protein ACJ8IK_23200 [Burkholderiaceae bacterium]